MMHFNLLDTRAGQDILHIGKIEGIAEGALNEKRNTAKLMLLENMPLETICKFTALSEQEIIALKPEIEKMKH
ncbi:hypothetical protein [Candidatus Albibeggiatoa sp. nov. BB20]|uniref:hypothetical protein n=1 Tax=Candidatus Albibeggiatoa sp. nov. BB20 TaxID=3162723 RepID=UPI0033658525